MYACGFRVRLMISSSSIVDRSLTHIHQNSAPLVNDIAFSSHLCQGCVCFRSSVGDIVHNLMVVGVVVAFVNPLARGFPPVASPPPLFVVLVGDPPPPQNSCSRYGFPSPSNLGFLLVVIVSAGGFRQHPLWFSPHQKTSWREIMCPWWKYCE